MDTANSTERIAADPRAISALQAMAIGRWQDFAGEVRANVLRIAGIAAFYLIELLNYHGLHLGPLDMPATVDLGFHRTVTAIVVAWTMMALATLICLQLRIFPRWLKYATTLGDVVLLSVTLMIADGPRSPLIVGYFLVIVLAGLRLQLALVWAATATAMLGYLWMSWFAGRPGVFSPQRDLRVPGYYQLIMLLALALTGIVLGQIIRRARAMADELLLRMNIAAGSRQP